MSQLKNIMKKEYWISLVLLIIPVSVTGVLMWPHHEEFTATGDIESVQELGIDGSVYFTYVEMGVTANRYEKIITEMEFDQIEFFSLDEEELNDYGEYLEEDDVYKSDTIYNAVVNANAESESSELSTEQLTDKVWEIIDYTDQYSGDSFGLMIAIGLVEEMTNEDFSQNDKYTIAGTGTIEFDQTVGSVGGIRQKLLTAEQNDVDYFFIPKDAAYFSDETLSNQVEAEHVVKEEFLTFELVPVETLDEALFFLRNLP